MNVAIVRGKGTAKGQKVRPQIWNAQKERKERKKGQKVRQMQRKGFDEKTAPGLQRTKARRASTLQVHENKARTNIDYIHT